MRINTINIQQYSEYLDTVDSAVFQQSKYHAKKFEHDGWTVEFIQAVKKGSIRNMHACVSSFNESF